MDVQYSTLFHRLFNMFAEVLYEFLLEWDIPCYLSAEFNYIVFAHIPYSYQ